MNIIALNHHLIHHFVKKRFFDKYCSEEKMFKAKFNDKKFKTNVRLCINRLKLVEKKKTEMALKARKEIADYIKISKTGILVIKSNVSQKDIKLSMEFIVTFYKLCWRRRQFYIFLGHVRLLWIDGILLLYH